MLHIASSGVGAKVQDLMRRFWPYLRRSRGQAGLVALLTFLEPLAAGAVLFLVSVLIDEVFAGGRLDLLPMIGGAYVAIIVVRLALEYATATLEIGVEEQIAQDLRKDLYTHVISVSPGSLGKHGTGDILTRLSSDVRRIEFLIFSGPLTVFADVASALFFLCFLLVMSWKLTLCALLIVPFLVLASLRFAPRVRRASSIAREEETAWMSRAEERLGAAPLMHAFGGQALEAGAFAMRSNRARRAEIRTVKIQSLLSLVVESFAAAGGLLVIAVGAYEIQAGALTLGAFVAFLGAIGSLYGPTRGLAKAPGQFQRAAASGERVARLLDMPSMVTEKPSAKAIGKAAGALEYNNVHFAYAGGEEVLKGVSLKIEPGEMLAIVGPSGGGKSTLAQLALRLYDPTSGSVTLDGTDLRDLTIESLRRSVSVVFQESYVFGGTIMENIRYGRPDASDAAVKAAARTANVDSFISAMRGGYHAQVGPRGSWLSGGQRQRIALARALLRDPPVLMLDEATAAVDSEAEELIQDAVERLAGRRTIMVIGHRLSSIRRADRIVVVDQGRIVEAGIPSALLQTSSRARDLFATQLTREPGVAA